MDKPEKLATQDTQDEEKENKNTTQYVLDITLLKITLLFRNRQFPAAVNDLCLESGQAL